MTESTSIMTNISRQLAQHVRSLEDAVVPDNLYVWIKNLYFDYFAVAAGGVELDSSKSVRESIPKAFAKSEGMGCRVLGTDFYSTVEHASLVAGTTSHGLELDDTFEEGSSHPGVVIMSAISSLSQTLDVSWDRVMRATIAGYDVMGSLGSQMGAAETYARGFHPTAVVGAVAAASASAFLLRLNEDQTAKAISLASNMAAGSLEYLSGGSWTKRLNAGHAAATGVRAAYLAEQGFTAPETSIEGTHGFLKLYGQGLKRSINISLGQGALETSIKFYPCCRYMHGNIDLLRDIHKEFPGIADQVESIELGVIEAGAALVAVPPADKLNINTTVDAQFSMPFGGAVALSTGTATVKQFEEAPSIAPQIRDLMAKISCVKADYLEEEFPKKWKAEAKLTLKDGTQIVRSIPAFKGAPDNPATEDDLKAKAEGLLGNETATEIWNVFEALGLNDDFSSKVVLPIYGAVSESR